MWHLLHKGLAYHKWLVQTRFRRIAYCCTGAHICLFFLACFVQRDDHLQLMVHGSPDARIVCLPSFMLPPQRARTRTQKKNTARKNPQRANQKKEKKQITARPQKNKPTTGVAETRKKKKLDKKKLQEKVQDFAAPEENLAQEEEPASKVEPIESLEQASDIIYVNRATYQMFEVAKELQEAIGLHWAPPAGMPAQTTCLIRVTIDAQGKATALDVVEKSGVAVFDMAARTAMRAVVYPQSVWGKTIVVHFNEEFA